MTESQVVNGWVSQSVDRTLLTDARAFLTECLTERFGTVPAEVLRTIEEQPSLSMLQDWRKSAWRAKTMDEFIAVLRR